MLYGYARISTGDQSLDLQVDALERAECDRIFADKGVSGSKRSRPELDELLDIAKEGDKIVVWRLDRLGRSLSHLLEVVSGFRDRNIEFQSLTEQLDTTSAGGRLIFHVMGALAEFERSLIGERTKAGMASAKKRGVHVGRPRAMSPERTEHAKQLIEEGRTQRQVARLMKVSPSTLFRAIIRI